jgi:AmmeMemoRadiSam system protein B/AmmeMemoRadiSam system protein A
MAGRWYPADAALLNQALDKAYSQADRRAGSAPGRPALAALIVPHAAMQYSGSTAAAAWRLVRRKPRNIILLGFSHRAPSNEVLAPDVASYTSVAGAVPVNETALADLGFRRLAESRLCDHSLENQLPFLRRSAPDVPIIPLYVGSLNPAQLKEAARKLAPRVRQGDLLVASSDFTHYGDSYGYLPFPNDSRTSRRLHEQARDAFDHIGSLDVSAFDRYLSRTGDTICGRDPIRLLMATLAEANTNDFYMTIEDAKLSGDLAGDYSLSVTYGALAFYPRSSFAVNVSSQQTLLAHSRATLNRLLDGGSMLARERFSAELRQRTGVFVTIRKQGTLRGCIGALAPTEDLVTTVADRTLAAAQSDPRFPALARGEGPVSIELSLLTPMRLLPSWRLFRDGYGAVLTLRGRGGLLLPQVATEMKWTPTQFLEGLSQKAGLPKDAYRDPAAKLYIFEAQVFGEPVE